MASRKDFAQRNSRPLTASRGSTPAKSAPARRSLRPLGLAAAAALGALVFGLFQLTGLPLSGPAMEPTAPQAISAEPSAAQTGTTDDKATQNVPAGAVAPSPETKDTATAAGEAAQARQNRFDFYDMLPKSEVEAPTVEAYKSTPRNAKLEQTYLLQAGSFRDPADAERMRAQLLLAGLPNVRTSKTEGSNGTWYRVRTGPFDNRADINKAKSKMAQMHIQSMQIQQ